MPQQRHGPRFRGRPLPRVRTDAQTDMAQAVAQDDRASPGRLRQGGTSHDARGTNACRRQRRRSALSAARPAGSCRLGRAAAERFRRRRCMRAWRNWEDAPASEAGGPRPMGVRLPPPVPRHAGCHSSPRQPRPAGPCQRDSPCNGSVTRETPARERVGRPVRSCPTDRPRRVRSGFEDMSVFASVAQLEEHRASNPGAEVDTRRLRLRRRHVARAKSPGADDSRILSGASQHRGREARHAPATRGTAVRVRPVFSVFTMKEV